jgi:phosphoglycerol transferase MdoB-like AlkP superfamily enzyme
MRMEGYRTICLHPFDRTFYRRDHVMPYLGFDVFLGEEAFPGALRNGLYVADTEVARVATEILREERSPVFLFAITMDNHGPWLPIPRDDPGLAATAGLPCTQEEGSLAQFLAGVRRSDAMLDVLSKEMSRRDGLCTFYGDHLPSLPATFAACDFHETSTDYAIWRAGSRIPMRRDLAAHDLSEAIFQAFCETTLSSSAMTWSK